MLTVSSHTELLDALSNAKGDGTNLLKDGDYGGAQPSLASGTVLQADP